MKFSAERGIRPRSLQRWAQRLEREDAATPTVRLARLVRTPSPSPSPSPTTPAPSAGSAVVIELGGARITVGHGADVAMVVSVLAMVSGGPR